MRAKLMQLKEQESQKENTPPPATKPTEHVAESL